MRKVIVTVKFCVPETVNVEHLLGEMAEEYYYANKTNEELSELLDHITWTVKGDNNASVQS